jgi:hypothetical protein
MAYLSAEDSAILADMGSCPGGFSVGPPPPYDPVGMAWANGRRCTDTPDPGPIPIPAFLWADGTPVGRYPQPPTASEWRALVAGHGLPMTLDGETVGNWPQGKP